MKVFFLGSYKKDEELSGFYKTIFNELTELGYTHLNDDVVNINYEELTKSMQKGEEAYVNHYKSKIEAVANADICIFETTVHSLGIGFLIQRALENSKPTIVLYHKTNIPIFLSGIKDEKLIIREYEKSNLKKILKTAIELARERRDKRFNFFISPKLLEYLEKISKEEGITKSKFIRNLILDHMRKIPTPQL